LGEFITIGKFSPADHYQLIISNLIHTDFYFSCQFSTNLKQNMHYCFNIVSDECIVRSDKPQFLSNNLYLYERT
jgi:hypothetical protein